MTKLNEMPEWVLKHKKKGTAIIKRKENYYLSRVTSKWDPIKKKAKRITLEYLGKITHEGVIPPKHKRNNDFTVLKKDDAVLQKLQIIKELMANKSKVDIAEKYNITTKTISNIKKRFEEDGVKGLIHTRSSNVETVKVSTPEQAAIITDVVQHPDKTAKEIKDETSSKLSISDIKKLILPLTKQIKLKKKIILEIE